MAGNHELSTEIQTCEQHKSEWEAKQGQFVLIEGATVVGFFETYEDALTDGYKQFGLAPFLVKEIRGKSEAQFVSRLVVPQVER